jgi:molybdopterin/thiamine biosynthesis adenylyltransferase
MAENSFGGSGTSSKVIRYGRQMLLSEIGSSGQDSLLRSKVLIVGAGGIGSTAAMYLGAAGVNLVIMDGDIVEETNLHR